jgi:chemotaxis protein methyltransferase WspC
VAEGPAEFGIYRRAGAGSKPHTTLIEAQTTAPAPEAHRTVSVPPAPGALAAARVLADSGRLADARAACEHLLRVHPADADARALLGVVHLAAGNEAAAYDSFGKALYLAPDHIEAISHMIGLCARRGNPARAEALRKRLARLAPAEGT